VKSRAERGTSTLGEEQRLTLYPPAVWRRLLNSTELTDAAIEHDTGADRELRISLLTLAHELNSIIVERGQRVAAIAQTFPEAREIGDALALAGFTAEDAGLPDHISSLPDDLNEARSLLAWLQAHPSKLPPVNVA
jgi:hypothetical protein